MGKILNAQRSAIAIVVASFPLAVEASIIGLNIEVSKFFYNPQTCSGRLRAFSA